MGDKMVGLDESYQRGYEHALLDIQKEINLIRLSFQKLSVPIIESILTKLESKHGDH